MTDTTNVTSMYNNKTFHRLLAQGGGGSGGNGPRKKRNPYTIGSLEWIAWENALAAELQEQKRKEDNHAVLNSYRIRRNTNKPGNPGPDGAS